MGRLKNESTLESGLKNVIIVCDSARILGGIENVAFPSAIGLAQKGLNVTIFSSMGPLDDMLLNNGIHVQCLNQSDILSYPNRLKAFCQGIFNLEAYRRFNELLKHYNPAESIVHIHCWSTALSGCIFLSTSKLGFKTVVTIHDFFSVCPNGALFNFRKVQHCSLKPLSLKCLACNCDARNYIHKIYRYVRSVIQEVLIKKNKKLYAITISNTTCDLAIPLLKGKIRKSFYLRNPVLLNEGEVVNIAKNDYYLFIGRLSKEKGTELFCEAITQLGLKGIVLGNGYLLKSLKEKFPKIIFVGWVAGKEKDFIIRKAKALVASYLWNETFGLVIPEMKSYGIPCIVPDKGGPSEQIEDGIDGFHYAFGEIESLKKVLLKYEEQDLGSLQKRLLSRFNHDDYTIEVHIKRLINIYNDILKQ